MTNFIWIAHDSHSRSFHIYDIIFIYYAFINKLNLDGLHFYNILGKLTCTSQILTGPDFSKLSNKTKIKSNKRRKPLSQRRTFSQSAQYLLIIMVYYL